MGRKPNGASSIYFGNDGYWHGRGTVGIRDGGRPDRRSRWWIQIHRIIDIFIKLWYNNNTGVSPRR